MTSGNDGNSGTMVLHSTPQTPMTQMTQFQNCQKFDEANVQYSINGSITSPVVGDCSMVGSLRRHDTRMVDSPHHHPHPHHADLNSIGGNSAVIVSSQQPCSPMISFKPMSNTIQQSQTTPGILASPLPQPPNICSIKGTLS